MPWHADSPVLFVLHDFPPQAIAGTELHVLRLAQSLGRRRPVAVFHTLRDPALPQYAVLETSIEGVPVIRVVQNYPYRPLGESLHDAALERIFVRVLERIRPDVVHFHHLAFLPLSLPSLARESGAATFFTLHDYFLACPSGGQLAAHPDGALCDGPSPERCGPCHARYGRAEGGLEALGMRLSRLPFIPPDLPFRAYRRLPGSFQALLKQLNPPAATAPAGIGIDHALARWARVRQLFREVDRFIAPSRDLAGRFERWGLPASRLVHLPNPAPSAPPPSPLPPRPPLRLLFLGTLAPHKGLDRVVDAVLEQPPGRVQLEVCGDAGAFPAYVEPIRRRAGPSVRFSGLCPPEDVGEALARAHVLVLGSRWPENAPLTVLEAHAAGRPVVAPDLGGIPELVRNGEDGLLYDTGDRASLPSALQRLVDEPGLLERLTTGIRPALSQEAFTGRLEALYAEVAADAPHLASNTDDAEVVGGAPHLVASTGPSLSVSAERSPSPAGPVCKATVVIPTCDGGPLLGEVVRAVLAQETPWPFELLVIDSSSGDGSLACLAQTSARLLTISRERFDHGRTRSDAAREARGEYLVYLVQDATPIGPRWLTGLVEAMEQHPDAVGGYARQRARPDADPALRRRIETWTPPGHAPVMKRADPESWRRLEPVERLRLAAFDNVCSIVRRDHLLEHPFPDAPFGEDLCWGEAQLLAGRALLYIPTAEVWHSHRRSFREHLRRARLEHTLLASRFGVRTVPGLVALVRQSGVILAGAPSVGHEGVARQLAEMLGQYLAGRAGEAGPFWFDFSRTVR